MKPPRPLSTGEVAWYSAVAYTRGPAIATLLTLLLMPWIDALRSWWHTSLLALGGDHSLFVALVHNPNIHVPVNNIYLLSISCMHEHLSMLACCSYQILI